MSVADRGANISSHSKPLSSDDSSAVDFVKEILKGDPTYAINFDRIQWDSQDNCYVILEYLLCDEKQFPRITPYKSHPNRYFWKNSMKFISLWDLTKVIKAKLYLINYSKRGTDFEDEVLLMEVQDIDERRKFDPVITKDIKFTRAGFSSWFRELNNRGRK